MTGPHRGPGAPLRFDDTARRTYLTAVTEGAKAFQAARLVGLTVQAINKTARTDSSFAAARDIARTHGRKVRAERMPHGESRYKHAKCRCPICTTDATRERTSRRHRNTRPTHDDNPQETAPILQLPHTASPTGNLPPLARAS